MALLGGGDNSRNHQWAPMTCRHWAELHGWSVRLYLHHFTAFSPPPPTSDVSPGGVSFPRREIEPGVHHPSAPTASPGQSWPVTHVHLRPVPKPLGPPGPVGAPCGAGSWPQMKQLPTWGIWSLTNTDIHAVCEQVPQPGPRSPSLPQLCLLHLLTCWPSLSLRAQECEF